MRPLQDKFRLAAKTALLERRITITELAKIVGKARPTVSRAINQNEFPAVRSAVARELRIVL